MRYSTSAPASASAVHPAWWNAFQISAMMRASRRTSRIFCYCALLRFFNLARNPSWSSYPDVMVRTELALTDVFFLFLIFNGSMDLERGQRANRRRQTRHRRRVVADDVEATQRRDRFESVVRHSAKERSVLLDEVIERAGLR